MKIIMKIMFHLFRKIVPYKWEKSAVCRGCPNAANASKVAARPEKGCRSNEVYDYEDR